MRSFKKIVAAFAAATMIMSIGSVAFADAPAAQINVNDGHNVVSLTNYSSIVDSTNQWTVIIISKADQSAATLTADKLYYINQGKSNDASGFWTNMGTKGDSLADGAYLMRIGGDSIEGYYEYEFSVSSTPLGVEVQLGDTNDDTVVNGSDLSPVINHILGAATLTGKLYFVADTNSDSTVNGSDLSPIINNILGASSLGKSTYIAE